MALVEADGTVRVANRAFTRLLGFSLVGRRLADVASRPDGLGDWLRMASRRASS